MDSDVTLDMPSALATFLQDLDLPEDMRAAYDAGTTVHRGRGYVRRITAPLDTHRDFLARCWVLAGDPGAESSRGERAGYGTYAKRIEEAS